ncbi:hypothetical protein BKA93DRAFT_523734 [Sparassis latifolia]
MSLTAVAFSLTFLAHTLAVPLDSGNTSSVEIVWVTDVVTSSVDVLDIATSVLIVPPTPSATPFLLSIGSFVPSPPSSVFSSVQPVTVTDTFTDVVTAMFTEPPTTTTVFPPPSTVTDTVTATPPSSSPSGAPAQIAWAAPAQMTNLASFNVTNFADGKQNMRIVSGLPTNVSTNALAADFEASAGNNSGTPATWDSSNSSAVMQLFYPAGSVNPSAEPQGGADFYAVPLDLTVAQNVSLEYSVFFPVDFDWVRGGKLPGLYGGHSGCSGGDDATTCFSTRLMWRPGGAGELYLYAPKDKQTAALCSTPPLSVCDSEYGLSVGRGSFTFTPGAWTTVRQTVALNTPGQQDGGFVLEVNGQEVINRSDVFYRDVPGASDSGGDDSDGDSGGSGDSSDSGDSNGSGDSDSGGGSGDSGSGDDSSDSDSSDNGSDNDSGGRDGGSSGGGLLGLGLGLGLYGDSLFHVNLWPGGIVLSVPNDGTNDPSLAFFASPTVVSTPALIARQTANPQPSGTVVQQTQTSTVTSTSTSTSTIQPAPSTQTVTSQTTSITTVYSSSFPTALPATVEQAAAPRSIGFTGLFFSTFFGGHGEDWATPKDQYVWFSGFSIAVNN